jgi:hypothetical protein
VFGCQVGPGWGEGYGAQKRHRKARFRILARKPTGLKGGALLPKEPAASLCDFCDFSFGRVFVNNNSTGF